MDLVDNTDFSALIDTIQKLPLRLGYVGVVVRRETKFLEAANLTLLFLSVPQQTATTKRSLYR